MTKKILLGFSALALSIASAETYKVTLFQPSVVRGAELKPGSYKLDVQSEKVLIKNGKTEVSADVKVENDAKKYNTTTVRYSENNGKYEIREIRLGGTSKRLVFNP